jgi:hypothetical protein
MWSNKYQNVTHEHFFCFLNTSFLKIFVMLLKKFTYLRYKHLLVGFAEALFGKTTRYRVYLAFAYTQQIYPHLR